MFFNKKVKLYGIFINQDLSKLLTIVENKKDIDEYVMKLLKLEFFSHYNTWLQVRMLEDSEDNWQEYFNTVIPQEDKMKYTVCKLIYNRSQLSSILRMFCGCTPLGCSFNSEAEYSYFNTQVEIPDVQIKETSSEDLVA